MREAGAFGSGRGLALPLAGLDLLRGADRIAVVCFRGPCKNALCVGVAHVDDRQGKRRSLLYA